MKKQIILFIAIIFSSTILSAQNYFKYNGYSDVSFRDLSRGNGGRAITHDFGNTLVFNYAGDFTGGIWLNGPKIVIPHYLGIGTHSLDERYKLSVNGNIRAKEITVETGWADYVFLDDYKLPTLEQVEEYINKNGHLINIPSATEVEKNGVNVGKMNTKLLEKIEELTLYVLQLNKKIKELEKLDNKKSLENINK